MLVIFATKILFPLTKKVKTFLSRPEAAPTNLVIDPVFTIESSASRPRQFTVNVIERSHAQRLFERGSGGFHGSEKFLIRLYPPDPPNPRSKGLCVKRPPLKTGSFFSCCCVYFVVRFYRLTTITRNNMNRSESPNSPDIVGFAIITLVPVITKLHESYC